ncbi:MAG: polysaccharide lyase family 7 protein [Planctomycetota bacterium]
MHRCRTVRVRASLIPLVALMALAVPSTQLADACVGCCYETFGDAPYDLEKFHAVLDRAWLQAPTSSPKKVDIGDYDGRSFWCFYLSAGRYMTFRIEGEGYRSELRQAEQWDTATTVWRKMIGRVKLFEPDASVDEFTFMQVHHKSSADGYDIGPLVRLVWKRSTVAGEPNHLWAILRTNLAVDGTYEIFDLGAHPGGFFKAEIKVKEGDLRVKIDDITLVSEDVSYWNGLETYFKAGVYNQSPGHAKVQFDSLKFYGGL